MSYNQPFVTIPLPGVNWRSAPSVDDLSFFSQALSYATLMRLRLAMGYVANSGTPLTEYGIVDASDPSAIAAGTVRPLNITVNASNAFAFDVMPGIAVSQDGNIALVDTNLGNNPMPAGAKAGDVVIVYIQSGTVPSNTTLTRSRVPVASISDMLTDLAALNTVFLRDFQNLTEVQLQNVVVLAIINVTSTGIVIDTTIAAYSWNRPWFSPVDARHRAMVGSGVVTSENPHGISPDNMTYKNFTLLQLIQNHGCILARDRDVRGVPGYLCYEQLAPSNLNFDLLGTVTGVPFTKYFYPSKWPRQMVFLRQRYSYATSMPVPGQEYADSRYGGDNQFGPEVVMTNNPGAPFVTIPWNDSEFWNVNILEMAYTTVDACSVSPQLDTLNGIQFAQPTSDEAILTEGQIVDALTVPTVSLANCAPVKQTYNFWVDAAGVMHKDPEVLVGIIEAKDITTPQVAQVSATMPYPFHIEIALVNPTLPAIIPQYAQHIMPVLEFQVSGTAVDGTGTTQTIVARFSSNPLDYMNLGLCEDPGIPGPESDGTRHTRFLDLANLWATVTSISISTNDTPEYIGPNTQLVFFTRIAHNYGTDRMVVGRGWWTGSQLCNYVDLRHARTYTNFEQMLAGQDPNTGIASASAALMAGPTWAAPLSIPVGYDWESFVCPHYVRIDELRFETDDRKLGIDEWYHSVPIYIPVQDCAQIFIYPVGGRTVGGSYQDFISTLQIRVMGMYGVWTDWMTMSRYNGVAPFMYTAPFFYKPRAFQLKMSIAESQAQGLSGLAVTYFQNTLLEFAEATLAVVGLLVKSWITSIAEELSAPIVTLYVDMVKLNQTLHNPLLNNVLAGIYLFLSNNQTNAFFQILLSEINAALVSAGLPIPKISV